MSAVRAPAIRLTRLQHNALTEAVSAGRLERERHGWVAAGAEVGAPAHGFFTVFSLHKRALLEGGHKGPLSPTEMGRHVLATATR